MQQVDMQPLLIDTHAHLYDEAFESDRAEVVERAFQSGVQQILLPNINKDTIEPMLALCEKFPQRLFPMMGLHPTDVMLDYHTVLDNMENLLFTADSPYIGIGEIGLDFYWSREYEFEQIEAFQRQIYWAIRTDLPLMIHSRSAHAELVQIMKQNETNSPKMLRGVFHCFSGTRDEAEELLAFEGFLLGIGGVLTYKKSTLPDFLREIPLDRIVLETDSPYLPPTPFRGKRNESAYLIHVLEKLATIYGCSPGEVAIITSSNARKLFFSRE